MKQSIKKGLNIKQKKIRIYIRKNYMRKILLILKEIIYLGEAMTIIFILFQNLLEK